MQIFEDSFPDDCNQDTHSYKSSPAFDDVPIMDSQSSFSSRPNFDRLRKKRSKRAQLCAARI